MSDKKVKMISVRITKNMYDSIIILNTLQRQQGNIYTVSETVNMLLQKSKIEIENLKKNDQLFN